jgi:hypothetical protein
VLIWEQLNSHDARCSKIADGLAKAKHYWAAYLGMQNTDIIIKIKMRITSLLEGIASEGTNALDSAFARLEEDMKVYGLTTPELSTTQAESEQQVQWEWDDHRQDHYYWVAEGYFQYHKGGRVRPDGTPYGELVGGQLLLEDWMVCCVSKDCRVGPDEACCLERRKIVEIRKNMGD